LGIHVSPPRRGAARGESERQACPTKRGARSRTGLRHVRDDPVWPDESDPCPIEQFRDADPRLEALAMMLTSGRPCWPSRRSSMQLLSSATLPKADLSSVTPIFSRHSWRWPATVAPPAVAAHHLGLLAAKVENLAIALEAPNSKPRCVFILARPIASRLDETAPTYAMGEQPRRRRSSKSHHLRTALAQAIGRPFASLQWPLRRSFLKRRRCRIFPRFPPRFLATASGHHSADRNLPTGLSLQDARVSARGSFTVAGCPEACRRPRSRAASTCPCFAPRR
jgi:hypothetical protein